MKRERWREWALLFCSAAVAGLAGCGGGGAAATGVATASASGAGSPSGTGAATGPASNTVAASSIESAPASASGPAPMLGDCELFPSNAIFNTRIDDVSRFPAHPNSAAWVSLVGSNVPFTTNWGTNDNPANFSTYYGMPINIVDGTAATTDWPVVSFDFSTSGVIMDQGYPDRSDCAVPNGSGFDIARGCGALPAGQRHFPFPVASKLLSEAGLCNDPKTCGDKHVLVVEQGACRLWESFFSYKLSNQWYTMATAAWELKSLALRPADWTSGDAAGLPITPLLAKAAEASSGEIRHALRVNFRNSALSQVFNWPARFAAGSGGAGSIPFGALLRLKADFVIPANWTPQARALATAAKRYGMYVSDNGADFYVTGEPSAAWDPVIFQQMKAITMSNMEFVDLKAITSDPRFSPDSMAASW